MWIRKVCHSRFNYFEEHQMKCLRTKCIETFPIYIYIYIYVYLKNLILHYQVLLVNKSHSEPHVFIWIF